MEFALSTSVTILLMGILVIVFAKIKQRRFGSLSGKRIYQDTEELPGEILEAKSLRLYGKPDYIIQNSDGLIPVEVKTGRTPQREPYLNHIMQLMAYCYLTEETYGKRPRGGILKYPDKEYKLQYTDAAKKSVEIAVKEILDAKRRGTEFSCKHENHN